MKRLLGAGIVMAGAVLVLATASSSAAPRPAPTVLTAVVNTDGTLARGTATGSSQLGTDGYYTVTFGQDVSQCTYVASGGTATATGILDDAVIYTVAPNSSPDAVTVLEYDAILARDSYSSGFHLTVVC